MNPWLDFLLSDVYKTSPLDPLHLADLLASGLSIATITLQEFRSVPPDMIDKLLGFRVDKSLGLRSAYVVPFVDAVRSIATSRVYWLDHIRVKVFRGDGAAEVRGDQVEERREKYRYNNGQTKYLVRRRSVPRLYFPIATMARALDSGEPLWVIEGCKKSLAAAQLGLPAIGLEGPWSWHLKGSIALLPDFAFIRLRDRIVELCPDSDVETNAEIARAMRQLANVLGAVGARPRLVRLPGQLDRKVGMDDFIMTITGAA